MKDIGIFASTHPVAIEQACFDAVTYSTDNGKSDLVERMTSRHAIHVVEETEHLRLGNRQYNLVSID